LKLWEDLRAHRLAEAEPESWDDWLRLSAERNRSIGRVRLESLAGAPAGRWKNGSRRIPAHVR